MNHSITFTDPGAILGKAVLRIGQVIFALLIIASLYMAFLASEGLFSGWHIELDSDLRQLFSLQDTNTVLILLFVGLGLKFSFWLGLLIWIGKKL